MFVHFDLYSLFPKLNLISEPNFSISTESGNTYVFQYYCTRGSKRVSKAMLSYDFWLFLGAIIVSIVLLFMMVWHVS